IIQWQVSKYGKEFRLVTPAYTSKTCSRCGYVKEDLTLNDRVFKCPRCGWTADRDYNAALNLLKHAGWEPPSVPVELRPLPLDILQGQGEAMKQEAPPLRTG
ncbi:MAG: zinc ribbon domain-containing protein, partial [Vulcanisaeta sp.]